LNIHLLKELDFILKKPGRGSFAALVTLLEPTPIDVHAEPKHIVLTKTTFNAWCMHATHGA
jgi:hypothetical protein